MTAISFAAAGEIPFSGRVIPVPHTGAFFNHLVAFAIGDFNEDGFSDVATIREAASWIEIGFGGGPDLVQFESRALTNMTTNFREGRSPSIFARDFNLDGHVDLAFNNAVSNSIGLKYGDGRGSFVDGPPVPAIPLTLGSFTIGDLNLDGRPDFASTSVIHTSVGLLLNGGDDTFTPQAIDVGTIPSFVEVSDFNFDGAPDLVTIHPSESKIRISILGVLKIKPLDFVFKVDEVDITFDESPKQVRVSDLNGDGFADLVALMPSNRVSVHLGGKAGQYEETQSFSLPGVGHFLSLLDFNDDGHTDVLAGSGLLLLENNGEGELSAAVRLSTPIVTDAGLADFDGNGLEELVGYSVHSHLTILTRNDAGEFPAPASHPFAGPSIGFEIIDLDGDGVLDAVSVDANNSVRAHIRDSQGGVGEPIYSSINGWSPADFKVADVDGDGCPDVLVGDEENGRIAILPGEGNGRFRSPHTTVFFNPIRSVSVRDFDGDGVPDVAVSARVVDTLKGARDRVLEPWQRLQPTIFSNSWQIAAGDFDGDAIDDLLVLTGNLLDLQDIFIARGSETGEFGELELVTLVTASPNLIENSPRSLLVDDFNSDGDLDFAVVTASIVVIAIAQADLEFHVQLFGDDTFNTFGHAEAIDFNHDGHVDIIYDERTQFGSRLWMLLNDGAGHFQPQELIGAIPSSVITTEKASGDFNGDSLIDLALVDTAGRRVFLLPGMKPNGFGPALEIPVSESARSARFVDLNADGRDDVVVSYTHRNGLDIFYSEDEAFVGPFTVVGVANAEPLAFADMDADGHIDALVTSRDEMLEVLYGDGRGAFHQSRSIPTSAFDPEFDNSADEVFRLEVGDFDGDGEKDVAALVDDPNDWLVRVGFGLGNGEFVPGYSFEVLDLGDPFDFVVADFNGDLLDDLCVVAQNRLHVLLSIGDRTFADPQISEVADMQLPMFAERIRWDQDEFDDLVVWESGAQSPTRMRILQSLGNGAFEVSEPLETPWPAEDVRGCDFDRDGHLDLVGFSKTRQAGIFITGGQRPFSELSVQGLPAGINPRDITIADMDNDGLQDVVILNSGSLMIHGNSTGTCAADLDDSGNVNGADLAQLLSVWGTAHTNADLNGDGIVNGADIASLLSQWGQCN